MLENFYSGLNKWGSQAFWHSEAQKEDKWTCKCNVLLSHQSSYS